MVVIPVKMSEAALLAASLELVDDWGSRLRSMSKTFPVEVYWLEHLLLIETEHGQFVFVSVAKTPGFGCCEQR